jgi:hypothetical protein
VDRRVCGMIVCAAAHAPSQTSCVASWSPFFAGKWLALTACCCRRRCVPWGQRS